MRRAHIQIPVFYKTGGNMKFYAVKKVEKMEFLQPGRNAKIQLKGIQEQNSKASKQKRKQKNT